jgi:hypothetical protein
MVPYTPPSRDRNSFNCPHCNAYAQQSHRSITVDAIPRAAGFPLKDFGLTHCSHCRGFALWRNDTLLYPDVSTAPFPNLDLNQSIIEDYNEARSILNKSPRGAAALLRLCIQKLCKQLGEAGNNINTDIANLVKKGLSTTIQQALDSVRVIGNEAVHPGEMALKDDRDTALKLFSLINLIAQRMLTEPREVNELFTTLPASKLKSIQDRDS